MNKNIKNFIEEGEKELKGRFAMKDWDIYIEHATLVEDIQKFISSRQISLIKMIVEMVESEKVKRLGLNNKMKDDRFHDRLEINHDISVHNKTLDTISSKLKELINKDPI